MKKVIALSNETFRLSWNGKPQQCAADKESVIKYITNSMLMGQPAASFKIWSNYCPTGYDVTLFLKGELKSIK